MFYWSREKKLKVAEFDRAWDICEDRGDCDMRGGFEYRSIRKHWLQQNCPEPIDAFIQRMAN